MPMDGNARGDTDYDSIAAANPNFDKLSDDEKSTLRHYFEVLFTADTGYIKGNADVLPVTHVSEPLSTATGTPSVGADPQGGTVNSTVTADTPIVGTGSIV